MTHTYKALGNFGRLGNQLFQIAGTIGIAGKIEDSVSFPDWSYKSFFSVPLELFDSKDGIDLSGDYLQDFHYFENCKDQIKKYFSPSNESKEMINAYYSSFFNEMIDEKIISVHVRRGDYLNLSAHHPTCPIEYFEKSIDEISKEINEPFEILVFSDDIPWCKQQDIFKKAFFADQFNIDFDVFDLFAMTMCDAHIISNSTFSWWGAYLADSPLVYYPNPWYGPALQDIDVQNTLILPNWKKIDRN